MTWAIIRVAAVAVILNLAGATLAGEEVPATAKVQPAKKQALPQEHHAWQLILSEPAPDAPPTPSDLKYSTQEDEVLLDATLAKIFPEGFDDLSDETKAIRVLKYVCSAFEWKSNTGATATKFINEGYAICGGNCIVFQVLLKKLGIPVRYVGIFGMKGGSHAIAEAYYDGGWHLFDPSWAVLFYSAPQYDGKGKVLSLSELLAEPESGFCMHVIEKTHVGQFGPAQANFPVTSFAQKKWRDSTQINTLYRRWLKETFPVGFGDDARYSFPLECDLTEQNVFEIGVLDGNSADVANLVATTRNGSSSLSPRHFHTIFLKVPDAPTKVNIEYSLVGKGSSEVDLAAFPLKDVHILSQWTDGKGNQCFQVLVTDSLGCICIFSPKSGVMIDAIRIYTTE